MTKILIEVSGGVVDNVLCTDPEADVLILDHDVKNADDEEMKCYHNLLETADQFRIGLASVY